MTKRLIAILILLMLTLCCRLYAAESLPIVRIAIVTDGSSERVSTLRQLFLQEIRRVNRGEFDIQAPDDLQLAGKRTLVSVRSALEKVYRDSRTDLVLTLGVLSSHAAAQLTRLPKPTVSPLVSNHQLQDLPFKDGFSGKANLSYVSLDIDIFSDLEAFREIVPFKQLTLLIDGAIAEAIPGIQNAVFRAADALEMSVSTVLGADSAELILAAIPENAEAVYVGPLPALSGSQYQQIVNGLIERRLPSFAFEGKTDVERGILVGIAPAIQMDRLARRVALNFRRILLGEPASSLPVAFARAGGLVLNMRTARAINFSPKWQYLTQAELLHEEPEGTEPPLTLGTAVREAVKLNLDLRIARSNVIAGRENIAEARSALFPQIGISGRSLIIDSDEAQAAPGQSEQTTSGSITLDQVIYSEPVRANLAIQKKLQLARDYEREKTRLDVVLETTQSYLDVLRTKTNTRVQKDNLRLSRSNLELAKSRRRVGSAGPSEVFRWESEIANAKRAVVEAQAQVRVAEIALNALLHRPLERIVTPVEIGIEQPTLITSQQQLFNLIDNPASFSVLRDFIVRDAIDAGPEISRLNALIDAQERVLKSTRNAYWHPTVNLQAEHTEIFDRSGDRGPVLTGVDDGSTSIALNLSLPLLTSGSRAAQNAKAKEELNGLRLQHQAIAERIEQRVRSALHFTQSAYTAIRLSRQAADAAESNFVVVRDAYSRGTVSIIDLLDAQNAALVADLRAATAVYDFIRTLMDVERAAARFDFFLTPQDQIDWFARVRRYFSERGIAVPREPLETIR